jgi:hypothetical protein
VLQQHALLLARLRLDKAHGWPRHRLTANKDRPLGLGIGRRHRLRLPDQSRQSRRFLQKEGPEGQVYTSEER